MTKKERGYFPTPEDIQAAAQKLKYIAIKTPLQKSKILSAHYRTSIYLKREDLQRTRSYKIRGAYNKISSISRIRLSNGIVCASAGNHAQGVAYTCNHLRINCVIFMPVTTPQQKINQVNFFGGSYAQIVLHGNTFDEAKKAADQYCFDTKGYFIHPFNDCKVIEGQATVAMEIIAQLQKGLDYIFVPIGGGGLAAGICAAKHFFSPQTKIIGVEPSGAPSMSEALKKGQPTFLKTINTFIDGAAVQEVGDLTFDICRKELADVITVSENKVCQALLDLYSKETIMLEPAGALSIAGLGQFASAIKGKTIVCIFSGGNNDPNRLDAIKKLAATDR